MAVAFIFTIGIYFLLLLVELVLQRNCRNHVIVEILSLSFGVLAVILEVLIINPLLGWVALVMGCVAFVSVVFYLRNDFVNNPEEIRRVMNAWRNGNANEQEVNGMQDELRERDAVEKIGMDTLRNDNNGMQDELRERDAVEEIGMDTLRNDNNGMQDELRTDNANEQEVNGMQDELRERDAVEEIGMDTLRNDYNGMQDELRTDNAIEQQVNGMQDELRNGNANEQQQVNGMPDENQ